MRGTLPPFYFNNIRNTITDNIIFDSEDTSCDFKTLKISNVWDVPEYLQVRQKEMGPNIKMRNIKQYKGFLIDLTKFDTVEAYLLTQLSSRNRKKLRSKKRKLEAEHTIRYAFFYGSIPKETYDKLFLEFYALLEKRFREKEVFNNNLGKWNYYRELVYPMILEKRASMFAIYDGEKPITIAVHFHLKHIAFSYIQSYDIDYSAYNMGDISMVKRLDFFLDNGFTIVDLSMGETDYKIKWCNHHYRLFFHLFYNSRSIGSITKSLFISKKLELKQFLRDKDILGKLVRYDKLRYKIHRLKVKFGGEKDTPQ